MPLERTSSGTMAVTEETMLTNTTRSTLLVILAASGVALAFAFHFGADLRSSLLIASAMLIGPALRAIWKLPLSFAIGIAATSVVMRLVGSSWVTLGAAVLLMADTATITVLVVDWRRRKKGPSGPTPS